MRRRAVAERPRQDVEDFWAGVSYTDDELPERRAPGGVLVTLFLLLLLAPALGVAAERFSGQDGDRYTVAALALLPFGIPLAGLVLLLALPLRRWLTALAAVLVVGALVAAVLPRATADRRPFAIGITVRALSVNLRAGAADPARVVDLVRSGAIDVLSLQELTPQAVADLDAAGLRTLLPNVDYDPRPGAAGSGLASRYPMEPIPLLPTPTSFAQPAAQIDLPDSQTLQVVAVHVVPPLLGGGVGAWQREMASLPESDVNHPVRMLIGDFNATLDHAALRGLIGSGYVDAADQTGQGLHGTWATGHHPWPALLPIDHVLVDQRCTVDQVSLFPVPGSDHRAIGAQFVIPDPGAH